MDLVQFFSNENNSIEWVIGQKIEACIAAKNGYDMLVGPQPDLLVSSSYNHLEICDSLSLITLRGEPSINEIPHGTPYSYTYPENYILATMTKYNIRDKKGHLTEAAEKALFIYLDYQINNFVDYVTKTHFRADLLNRFAFKQARLGDEDKLIITYRVDATPLFPLNPLFYVSATTIAFATPNVFAIKSQRTHLRAKEQ